MAQQQHPTLYRHAEDRPQDEATGEIGSGFSINVATAWEKGFFDADLPANVRRVALRSAMVMGKGKGGPLAVMATLARLGLGGAMGTGRQRMSWVSARDFCRSVQFLIEHDELAGCVNIVSPDVPVNRHFMRAVRQAVRMPIGLPSPKPMMEIGAFFLRTETELPLKSRWVRAKRLIDAGFTFEDDHWSDAVERMLNAKAERTPV